jgi:hypothetical protein
MLLMPDSRVHRMLLGLILACGAILRFWHIGGEFPSSDHAELAAILVAFYPRSIASFLPGPSSTALLLTNPHGVVSPVIALVFSWVYGLAGITITEFWWNVPFALLGSLLPLLAYRVALLPIHVSFSRASGLSHIPLTAMAQLLIVDATLRLIDAPSPRRAYALSAAIVFGQLVEIFVPLLFVLLIVASIYAGQGALRERWRVVRRVVLTERVLLAPLVLLIVQFGMLLLYTRGILPSGGGLGRLFEGSDRRPGLYLGAFRMNVAFVIGPLAGALAVLIALRAVGPLYRLERQALPLAWSGLYLLPFVLFTRDNYYGYLIYGLVPLMLQAAIVLAAPMQRVVLAQGQLIVVGMLAGLLGLRALSMVWGMPVPSVVGTGIAQGGRYEPVGLKAAAWWLREHSSPDALIFADAAYESYQTFYYTRRPFLGVTDAKQPEEAYLLLADAPRRPSFYLVQAGNEALLRRYAVDNPQLLATVTLNQEPKVLIYGHEAIAPATIEVAQGDRRFDEQFGVWRAMFAIGGT